MTKVLTSEGNKWSNVLKQTWRFHLLVCLSMRELFLPSSLQGKRTMKFKTMHLDAF